MSARDQIFHHHIPVRVIFFMPFYQQAHYRVVLTKMRGNRRHRMLAVLISTSD